jgi:hypothetical protein
MTMYTNAYIYMYVCMSIIYIGMCELVSLQYRAALGALRAGVHCILYGVDVTGGTSVQSCHVQASAVHVYAV